MKVQGRVRNNYCVRLEVSADHHAPGYAYTHINTESPVSNAGAETSTTSSDREDGFKSSAGGNHHAPPATTRWIRSE